jgi:hypothetical protein
MGFFCSRTYAHTHKNTEALMPYALKGIDATLFSVFHALGMNVAVRPILGEGGWETYDENAYENGSDNDSEDPEEWCKSTGRAEVTRAMTRFRSIKIADETIEDCEDPAPVRTHLISTSYSVWNKN